ncbi:hypothetical protein E0H75_34395 [Kribbella capetownensis]|uniref:Uncharacterized protein n=1 Tax=Kribbella capetownensis TaxID=1572659 RepID=A0A4R0JIQ0_9ACTN|nr:hypothetical protein [Kribbella capetownensis]TCC44656.1 hypothetical protein E0H75_34395 [Kribbella capetownensis]
MSTTAGPTSAPRIKRSIKTRLIMLATGAAASVALLTVVTPAMAQEYPSPEGASSGVSTAAAPVPGEGLDADSVVVGALAGIALGAAGLGITLGVQRRRDRAAMPIA